MQQSKKMEESFFKTHRDYIENLTASLEVLGKEISEAKETKGLWTEEWCLATESYLDELAKMIYSISEPYWLTAKDSAKTRELRQRIHDLYARYKDTGST